MIGLLFIPLSTVICLNLLAWGAIIYMGWTEYGFMLNQDRNDQERKHIGMHDVHTLDFFCVHMYVCLSACTCVCACMWYLGVCCWGPLRRSMLTRGAAGPPDVPIPARLVTRGPLLLFPYCTQICTHIQDFFIRLYIVHKQRTWMKSVSVQSDASSLWLKSRWCICLSIPKVETTLNIHVSHALVNCFCDAEDKAHHLWQSVQFPNPGGLFYFLHMAVWSHSRLDESWSGTFHGAMTLGGGCNHLEMSWERSTPTSQPSSTGWLMRF